MKTEMPQRRDKAKMRDLELGKEIESSDMNLVSSDGLEE